jgi:lysophospholipase L1-like esterase
MKKLIANYPKTTVLVFNLLAVLLLLFAAESYLSLTDKPAFQVKREGAHRAISLREGRPHFDIVFYPEPYWKDISDNLPMQQYRTTYDENGFLTPSKVHEQADKEIYFLGGSTTFCEFMDEEARFPTLSAGLLSDKTGLKVNGYNGGMSFNNSLHSINALLNKVVPQHPDVVVMMHATNDVFTLSTYESYYDLNSRNVANIVELPQPSSGFRAVAKGLRDLLFPNLYKLSLRAIPKLSASSAVAGPLREEAQLGGDFKGTAFYAELFERNLRHFINICRESGTQPVLMTQAHRLTEKPDPAVKKYVEFLQGIGKPANTADAPHYLPVTYAQYAELERAFNESIRKTGAERGVLVIDLEKHIPQTSEYMYDAFHLTEKGSRLAASVISDSLADALQHDAMLSAATGRN